MAYKDVFLAHSTHPLWLCCSCESVVLLLEPRLTEKNLSEHPRSLQQRGRNICTSHMLALKASAQKLHISGHILSAKASYMATPELIGWGCIILPQGRAWEYLALVIQSTTGISSKTRLNLLLIVLSSSKAYSSPPTNFPFLL